jgi:hypothetical protein
VSVPFAMDLEGDAMVLYVGNVSIGQEVSGKLLSYRKSSGMRPIVDKGVH